MREAFFIFEGGGAKGLAHIGALRAAERRNIRSRGVAGASAGAITASLVAAGYTATELFSLEKPDTGKLDRDFTGFFDQKSWRTVQLLREFIEVEGFLAKLWMLFPIAFRLDLCVLSRLWRKKGVVTTQTFVNFFDELLREKVVNGSGISNRVVCKDLPKLALVACDLDNQKLKVFSATKTPDTPVAEAVAASISIPFFFEPTQIGSARYIDGGVLSNFPAWIFDEERRLAGPSVPTYGFRLFERNVAKPAKGFFAFTRSLFQMLKSGDPILETRQIENFHPIPLLVQCSTLDFDMYPDGRRGTYSDGELHAEQFFHQLIGHQDPDQMEKILADRRQSILTAIYPELGPTKINGHHLRCNVIMPTTQGTLRVMYSSGMEQDADDQLEFQIGSGACSRCFTNQELVICDLQKARKDLGPWKMDKYRQALVRPTLKSLLCIPILVQEEGQKGGATVRVIGVLNFDSDDDILAAFATQRVSDEAVKAAAFVSFVLTNKRLLVAQDGGNK